MVKQIPGGTAKKYLIYHNLKNKSRIKERPVFGILLLKSRPFVPVVWKTPRTAVPVRA